MYCQMSVESIETDVLPCLTRGLTRGNILLTPGWIWYWKKHEVRRTMNVQCIEKLSINYQ